jgi:hypothetical protein
LNVRAGDARLVIRLLPSYETVKLSTWFKPLVVAFSMYIFNLSGVPEESVPLFFLQELSRHTAMTATGRYLVSIVQFFRRELTSKVRKKCDLSRKNKRKFMASPQEQKDKFENGFQQIVDSAPVNVGSKWNGRYNWMDPPGKTASQPKVDAVVNKLPAELKEQYDDLLNNFKHNRL